VVLAEWRRWWATRGESELAELLRQRWDPFADGSFEAAVTPHLAKLARDLHEGASLLDVQRSLNELRRRYQPERHGQKWINRDRAVGRHLVAWYEQATGERRDP
jgi:hypothetical protein